MSTNQEIEKAAADTAAAASAEPGQVPDQYMPTSHVSRLLARRQSELLAFVAVVVVALVALGVSPAMAVSTAFGAGVAAIELRRRSDSSK